MCTFKNLKVIGKTWKKNLKNMLQLWICEVVYVKGVVKFTNFKFL